MRESREARGLRAKLAFDGGARKATIALAVYAVAAPLVVAAILASGFPSSGLGAFGPATFLTVLAMTLLGPGLAVATLALRGHAQIAADLVERGDSEPQQAILRLAIAGAVLVYLALLALVGAAGALIVPLLAVNVAGILSAWLLLVHLMAEPSPSTARRVAAMLNDVVLVSVFLHIGGAYAAPWFSLYLWVIFGFGFRFGVMPLIHGAILSVAGFAAVYATTPFWQSEAPLAAGILLALVLMPVYAAALIRRLIAARAEAQSAAAAKSRFLAIMSHELRAPVNGMIGLGSLLARTKLDAEQRSALATMQHAARGLLGLIDDLLDLSKLEDGALTLETESFVLHEIMGAAVAIVRPEAEAKGQALTLRIDPRLPHVYRGCPQQLRQVLVNLLANAVKFTPAGHIAATATRATQTESRVIMNITVRDDGVGIPKEAQAGIFEVFAGTEGGAPRRYGGTGLGLALAKQLVELMGGTITLDSEVGKGSIFTVRLPLEPATGDAVRPPDLLGRKLVVISSDNELAGMMESRLSAWRAEVQWVADSETALGELALAGKSGSPSIVFIDGRENPLAALSLAHRSATAMATPPLVLFLAPAQGGEAITRLAASPLAAVIEAPMTEADLASALRGTLAGESLAATPDFAATEDGAASPLPRGAAEGAVPGAARRRILVADDNAANRTILKSLLENAGHEVELAGDGEAALSALDRSPFDLALLDIDMTEVSGYEVAKLYRVSHIGERRLPIIALTADATTETERLCREAGMDAVLTKPVDAAQLLAEIDAIDARAARPEKIAVGAPRVVTPITAHPRFVPETAAVVDEDIFAALRKLGGQDFLVEVIETFRKDAWLIVERLKKAAEAGDLREFRELMHSLRSGAVNVGGVKLCNALTGLRDISARELSVNGAAHVEKLKAELARLDAALDQMLDIQRRG